MTRTLALTALLALAACGQQASGVYTFTQADLKNAIAIDQQAAASPNPAIANPAKVKLACDQWVSDNLALLQSQTNAAPVTGIFSATSAADVAANNVLEALGPAGQASFELGCGPEVTHVIGLATGFKALQIVAPAAVTAIK
jgi:hypothetical protein